MKQVYLAGIVAIAGLLVAGIASAHLIGNTTSTQHQGNWEGMHGMMGGDIMDMHNQMHGESAHSKDDIEWMKEHMQEHMSLTDEELDEMIEHCPMMR